MRITDVRINGLQNPMGFSFEDLALSYTVDSLDGELVLGVYLDEDCTCLVHSQHLDYAQSFCTKITFRPEKETRYYLRIFCGSVHSDLAWFETGTEFDVHFITPTQAITHPVLFKEFTLKRNILSARLYVTGVGLYEAFLNGGKVGNEYLTPYCNDYNAYLQYQTYDVTQQLFVENKLEIKLGSGWYMGRFGLKHRENIFGSEFSAAAKLVVHYTDGTSQEICTDDSWMARCSHVTFSNIYDGEIRDDTLDVSSVCSCKYHDKAFTVVPRRSLPVIVKQKIRPTIHISPKGEQILDFGQNFTGFVSFDLPLQCGQTVKLTAGEVLQNDCFYRENLRTAKAEFVYTSDGIRKEVRPQFTFYGFRYMLVEGVEHVCAENFTGNVIYSDLKQTAWITTDNPKINRLLQNCIWGQRSNFVDVPTDCPQRDERLGWTGDAQVFSKTACYQMDCRAFYDKYLHDIAVDQGMRNGGLAVYSPSFGEGENAYSVWGDAATIIPWNLYTFYGDETLLRKHFPIMESYLQSVLRQDDARGGARLYNFGFHLGDWLSQDGASPNSLKGATDEYFIASVYYLYSTRLVASAASILGYHDKHQTYSELEKQIYAAILNEFFTPSGRLAIDTQTAYIICVAFDIYKDHQKLVDGFKARIKKDSYKIKGGFVGATQVIQALIKAGLTDEAFRMLYSENFPSWLYCVNLGATTIWERWNSLNADGSISGTAMNSLNHYSFGAVAEAFYGYIAGLRPVMPGFKKVVIEPKFNYRLKKLNFSFQSASGQYVINYWAEKNTIHMHVEIPFGAEAELILPDYTRILRAGEHNMQFVAPVEMDHPFSIDMPICDLLADHRSAAVFREISPAAFFFLSTTDMGLGGEPVKNLADLESFATIGSKLALMDQKLKAI